MGEHSRPPESDYAAKRARMVDVQIFGRDVRDRGVLEAMRRIPRHEFVPPEERAHAYEDYPLPIGHGQTISQPYIVASMTEHLKLRSSDRVLEIGTGCGYQTAVLAEFAAKVFTIEVVSDLQSAAKRVLAAHGYSNIVFMNGDGNLGWPDQAPFDAIMLTAAAPRLPPALIEQLAVNGRMIAPILVPGTELQELVVVNKTPHELKRESLYQVRFVPMRGSIQGS